MAAPYFDPDCSKGRTQEARQILIEFHGGCDPNSELVAVECTEIQQAIDTEAENNMSWKDFFSSRTNLKRLFLCFATAVFSQSSGNLLISNYLTQILKDTGLKSQSEITLMDGMVTLWQYVVAMFVALVVDKFCRRFFFLTGSGGVVVTFLVRTIAAQQYLEHNSVVAVRVVITCIFFFQAFYTFAWTYLTVIYPLEVVTLQMRAKTWVFVLLTIQVASIFGSYVSPIGLKFLGWKFYIYYCVWVLVVFLVVYFFFVVTADPTLEELAYLSEGEDIKPGIGDKVAKQKEQVQYEEHMETKSA
ncbi:Major facilitator superfamily domain general substrate transporter [Penicillium cf. griseofulvum]|uniref:Major facilitator superfamily domain general substrate transporter n=1 Tax=Penicillium cf. griseofulvum TaxID=2972120 RepID=A0A9W9JBT8_9EURO|nr:Major facilitator superfamily domain general substrate transporter [Penicillium cf. griseofulvum]KAJ5445252.1 Major facilitator superfamily domain general substrate transporter [Penicillium cf. griseofulvum]